MAKKELQTLVEEQKILSRIYVVRGQKVMLDEDLSRMYRVETKRLNEQVKRNQTRFPRDFMFTFNCKRVRKLEVANCDIKKLGRQEKVAECIYRAGSGNVVKCFE